VSKLNENKGLTLKHISVLSNTNITTVYKYAVKNSLVSIPSSSSRGAKYSPKEIRKITTHYFANKNPARENNKRIAGFHFKGGTGKSSINTELSVLLALLGYKVLLVDADQQGHASHILGFNTSDKLSTLYDCFKNNFSIEDVIINVFEGMDVIPANLSLSNIESVLRENSDKDSMNALANLMKPIEEKYDYIIFDTAPSITDLNRNIFYYVDDFQLICDTQPASVQSLSQIEDYLREFRDRHLKQPPNLFIIPNKYEDRASSSVETISFLQKSWKNNMISDFAVRKSEDIPRAFLEQTPLSFFCKVNSIAFEDISIIARHLVSRTNKVQEEK